MSLVLSGGEGQVRPSSASPSSMRASAGLGAPAPEDVLARAQMYYGDEGAVRPGSASPSLLQHSRHGGGRKEGAPVPEEVLRHASMFIGAEGATRPGSAVPSGRGAAREVGGEAALGEWRHSPLPLQLP